MDQVDVAVVGAGLVGAAVALALGESGLRIALVDPHRAAATSEVGWDSRVYAISPGNAGWLERLGVWRNLAPERLTRVEAMEIYGDRGAQLNFSAYEAGLRELAWIVENRLLQAELARALDGASHVEVLRPAQPREILWERDAAMLMLEGGRELRAKLVVGADGADSWVRDRAGIGVRTHEYGQLGVVANFTTERPHEGVAFQWFRDDGILALLPLPGNRVSMVWSTPLANANALLELSTDTLARAVEDASGFALGALEIIAPPLAFSLKRQHVERLVEPRAALVGDAAHNVHPLAGQGVNLGFRDARELARVLVERGPHHDCGDYALLRRYERARKEDIAALALTTDGLEKLFGARAVWMAGLRNWGLNLVDAQGPLKSWMIRHAAA